MRKIKLVLLFVISQIAITVTGVGLTDVGSVIDEPAFAYQVKIKEAYRDTASALGISVSANYTPCYMADFREHSYGYYENSKLNHFTEV
jgi:hypothetical protein